MLKRVPQSAGTKRGRGEVVSKKVQPKSKKLVVPEVFDEVKVKDDEEEDEEEEEEEKEIPVASTSSGSSKDVVPTDIETTTSASAATSLRSPAGGWVLPGFAT
jgi:hypothetical protein